MSSKRGKRRDSSVSPEAGATFQGSGRRRQANLVASSSGVQVHQSDGSVTSIDWTIPEDQPEVIAM